MSNEWIEKYHRKRKDHDKAGAIWSCGTILAFVVGFGTNLLVHGKWQGMAGGIVAGVLFILSISYAAYLTFRS